MTDGAIPATKADINQLHSDINGLRDEMRTYYATKADMLQMESRLIRWMVGLMVGATAMGSTLALVVERLIGG